MARNISIPPGPYRMGGQLGMHLEALLAELSVSEQKCADAQERVLTAEQNLNASLQRLVLDQDQYPEPVQPNGKPLNAEQRALYLERETEDEREDLRKSRYLLRIRQIDRDGLRQRLTTVRAFVLSGHTLYGGDHQPEPTVLGTAPSELSLQDFPE